MSDKYFISPNHLLCDSFLLARQIFASGFRPDVIVGIWRGGTPVGIAVQEALDYLGVNSEHFAARTASYHDLQRGEEVRVYGLGTIVEHSKYEDNLLIVDDVHDSGKSIEAFISTLKKVMRRNTPRDIRVATPYFKPDRNLTERVPDYYIHATNRWLVFPHEVKGIDLEEMQGKEPDLRPWLT